MGALRWLAAGLQHLTAANALYKLEAVEAPGSVRFPCQQHRHFFRDVSQDFGWVGLASVLVRVASQPILDARQGYATSSPTAVVAFRIRSEAYQSFAAALRV